METPTLTILLPTVGRPSLGRTLESLRAQKFLPGDEVLLVCDGHFPEARAAWEASGLPGRCAEIEGPNRDWGHTVRNRMMPEARGDFLMHIDDDDVYAPGALETVREALKLNPGLPHIFCMGYGEAVRSLWQRPVIELGNVGTPMFVHPNGGRWGRWTPRYGGDYDFIATTAAMFPSAVWREEVIAILRPSGDGQAA